MYQKKEVTIYLTTTKYSCSIMWMCPRFCLLYSLGNWRLLGKYTR